MRKVCESMDTKATPAQGKVEAIYGPMFSGKTLEMLHRLREARWCGLHCQVFKPSLDDRYAVHQVVAHNGDRLPCTVVSQPNQILDDVEPGTDIVAIDEVQFFNEGDQVLAVAKALAEDGKRVILVGLDRDYRKELFSWIQRIDESVEVTRKTATCTCCGRPAEFTQRRITRHDIPTTLSRIDVGGAEKYEPRCADCHVDLIVEILNTTEPPSRSSA
jgi:thymidine kinase